MSNALRFLFCVNPIRLCAIAALMLAMTGVLGGCVSNSTANNSFAITNTGNGTTVAFESIDGPPPQVFDRMVGVLDSESKQRSLAVVSREAPAAFRIRSYLSAQIVHGKTVIAWVWDVYDTQQQRALRLSGEEPAGKAGPDPWAAADDPVLRKIAQAGFSDLSNMINTRVPDAPTRNPNSPGPAVASVLSPAPAEELPATTLGYTDQ